MTPSQYLNALKDATGIESDYALAKRLDANRGWIPEIRSGKRNVPLEMAYKLAIALELDPAQVVADLESQREKNPARAEFWRSFLSRAVIPALMVCTLALSCLEGFENAVRAAGGIVAVSALAVLRRAFGAYNLTLRNVHCPVS